MEKKKVLLYGGGGCHPFKEICPLLKTYLTTTGQFTVDYVQNDFEALRAGNIKKYDMVVVYNTGGQLPLQYKRGLMEFVERGGGYVHSGR